MLHIPGLYIANSENRGRGVFTAQDLSKGDLIEICPLLLIPKKEVAKIHKTIKIITIKLVDARAREARV